MLLTLLSFFATLSLLVFVHELGHFLVAKRAGVKVEELGFGYPPRLLTFMKRGETEYTLNAIPFGGFVRLAGEDDPNVPGGFASKSKRVRIAILAAGSFMNIILAFVLFSFCFLLGWPEPTDFEVTIVRVAPGSPAALSGLQEEDVILSIDKHPIKTSDDLLEYVKTKGGQEITLLIKRGEERREIRLTPRRNPPQDQGAMGVAIQSRGAKVSLRKYPLGQALVRGSGKMAGLIALACSVPLMILHGEVGLEAIRPVGPVAIAQLTSEAAQQAISTGWWFPILQLTGFISTALALTNLLPLPALDGGRLFFILIEAIRGKRLDPRKEGAIHLVGLALLMTIMLIITYHDIVSPLPPIKWPNPF